MKKVANATDYLNMETKELFPEPVEPMTPRICPLPMEKSMSVSESAAAPRYRRLT